MELVIHARRDWPSDAPVEIVERKGAGHPDTLCDDIAERVCEVLCREYRARFGAILHHNVDKVLLVGGAAQPRLGGGEVTQPIEVYLAGRAATGIDVDALAIAACREVLHARVPELDVDRDVRVISRIRPGAPELASLATRGQVPLANDSSIGVGFAPLTPVERAVLAIDAALASGPPALGPDRKVLAIRHGRRLDVTVACALIARHVPDLDAYRAAIDAARALALAAARASALEVDVTVNAADDLARGELYLTVTGTSAEAGDDGEVGRGNRANGLITPYRPMTMEAYAGKNPVNHIGKLYSTAADRIARAVAALPGVDGATCTLAGRIGTRIDEPPIVDVAVTDAIPTEISDIVRAELRHLTR